MLPIDEIVKEVKWKTSRSGGKGGQNVNKVETKAELIWDVAASTLFSEEQKAKIYKRLASHINKEFCLSVTAEVNRSQLKNKELATKKFLLLLKKAFTEKKKRLATKPSKASKERKLGEKKVRGEIKQTRKRVTKED
jgi:ribosome-associated protein